MGGTRKIAAILVRRGPEPFRFTASVRAKAVLCNRREERKSARSPLIFQALRRSVRTLAARLRTTKKAIDGLKKNKGGLLLASVVVMSGDPLNRRLA
jgi:hypothetical protein